MPTRRTFELIVVVSLLMWPARATVRTWAKRQLSVHQEGDVMHGVGEVLVTIA